ncbi:RND superfamily putative drug exporter [Nocardioides albertanoniae]|uniref:RND superfamily putative drug exporter n=2 Tax=Nocardioidaceae TaxID=85015 RepID=A0A543ACW1_9ACTN|nr:putative membrane protein, MmpL family [Nocardioidaceae bacterium Broad-1]TQL70418.1 RND superfamily putative drug exporter [Nocardioides albertanoniae]
MLYCEYKLKIQVMEASVDAGAPGRLARLCTAGIRFPRLVVVGWLVAAAAVTLGLPSLPSVVERSSAAFLPEDAPTLTALHDMDEAFGSGRTESFAYIVFRNENGLSAADTLAYRDLVRTLGANQERVSEVQHFVGNKDARRHLVSKDGQAAYLVAGLTSGIGSPDSEQDIHWLRERVADLSLPRGSSAYVTGDPAMITDLTTEVNEASVRITVVSGLLLVIILLIIYRRVTTVLVSLVSIGVALACARGVLAWAGMQGMSLSTYTDAFVTAIVLGAGTDYCVFLISRFREAYGRGVDALPAVEEAATRVGPALVASAGTVILAAICLGFTKLAIFSTTGPPMAICVAVTVAVSLTFTPALMVWFGPRIGPARTPAPTSAWSRVGRLVARRPVRVLVAGTAVLVVLAAFLPTMVISYDQRNSQPPDTPSNKGLAVLEDHFPRNETLPDYLLLESTHDMRNSKDLAVLNEVSRAVAKVDGVSSVRSITQPAGEPLEPASIARQLKRLATGLGRASDGLEEGQPDLERLSSGSAQLADAISRVADGAGRAQGGADRLANGTSDLANGLGRATEGTRDAAHGARQLQTGAAALATGIQTAHDQVTVVVSSIGLIVQALDRDLLCTTDPICRRSREGLADIHRGMKDELLPGLQEAANGANLIARKQGSLADGLNDLASGLSQAERGADRITEGQRLLRARLGQMADGTSQIAENAEAFAPGIKDLIRQTKELAQNLETSESYLRTVNRQADTPEAGGFYLPASALDDQRFAYARSVFLSPDGRVARIQVTGDSDPLSPDGLRRFEESQAAAENALNRTRLEGATVSGTGAAGLGADLNRYLYEDAKLVLAAVLLIVLLLLIIALRSLAAPLYLLASVALSCAAALGLTTLVFQGILGHDIQFAVPVITFVLLVAVGADYNILLMSRMRENGTTLTRGAVAEAVTLTGPVITSAGIIFASTFIALLTSPVVTLVETGFAVAAGLLLDTFVVRSLIVPACAALLEDHNWWPARQIRNPGLKGTQIRKASSA